MDKLFTWMKNKEVQELKVEELNQSVFTYSKLTIETLENTIETIETLLLTLRR